MIELPTKPLPPKRVDPKVLLLYGQPKIGKTHLLTQLPSCLILDTQEGTHTWECMSVDIKDYEDFENTVRQIKLAKKPYKFIALDVIDNLNDMAERKGTKNYKTSSLGKTFSDSSVVALPKGGGYFWIREAFKELFFQLRSAAEFIILVGHVRDKVLDVENNKMVVQPEDLDLTGRVRSIICSESDAIGRLYRSKESGHALRVSFKGDEHTLAQSRCPHLINEDFEFSWSKIYTSVDFDAMVRQNSEATTQ